jgi:hypothetical protein
VSTADGEVLSRIHRVDGPSFRLDTKRGRTIQFLRGTSGRASIALAALYTFLAASKAGAASHTEHHSIVKQEILRVSALWTTVLCMRSIYDDAADSPTTLQAKSVAQLSVAEREQVTEYWARNHFELTAGDLIHAVGATALVGGIIYHFDEPRADGDRYLMSIDSAAHAAAVELFPESQEMPRLFDDRFIARAIHDLYSGEIIDGVEYLSRVLPSVAGWD